MHARNGFPERLPQRPPPPDQPTRVYGVEVDVDGLRSVGVDLHHGRGGEHQDVRAGRVLRGAQLRRLHVERRAAAEHRAR